MQQPSLPPAPQRLQLQAHTPAAKSAFSQTQRIAAITGVLAFVGGMFVGWSIAAHRTPTIADTSDDNAASTTQAIDDGQVSIATGNGDRITVHDQKAGGEVAVAGVVFSQPGWVAIREEVGGQPGRIIGAQWFATGTHEGSVSLLRSTKTGATYDAYLYFDDGDKKFDSHKDIPVTENGLLVLTPFTTTK